MSSNGPEWSYNQHHDREVEYMTDELPTCYSNPESVDAWRHVRMYSHTLPLLKSYPDSSWMTVGDGVYASDAYFLKQQGAAEVLATSISDHNLAIAKEHGFIDRYQAENAEQLSQDDQSFDFILCKESYHHFPRAPVALYEMLRVAKRGVVLIEPQETSKKLLDLVKVAIKKLMRGDQTTQFEAWGNFIFRVNVAEVEKMMTALNYEILAVRRFNDFYHPKLSTAKYARFSLATLLTKLGILVQDLCCATRLMDHGLVCLIAFTEIPSQDAQSAMKRQGFRLVHLPRNPYRPPNAPEIPTEKSESPRLNEIEACVTNGSSV